MLRFVNGIIFTLAALVAAGFVGVWLGVLRAGADVKPSAAETWAAKQSLHAGIARDTAGVTNPLPASDEDLLAGVKLYGAIARSVTALPTERRPPSPAASISKRHNLRRTA